MNHNHLGSDWLNYIFIVEGVIEEYVIRLLLENGMLKAEFTPKEQWQLKVQNMDGKDSISFTKVNDVIRYPASDYKNSHFVIVADNIIKKTVWFDRGQSDKEELEDLYGKDYNNRITYITFIPTTDILLVIAMGLYEEYKKSDTNSAIEFLNKKGHKSSDIKSIRFITSKINSNNILEICSKIPKLTEKVNDKHILTLKEIVK